MLKTLCLLGALLLGQQSPPQGMRCVEWRSQTTTVCKTHEDHTLGGAAVGWLVLGPLGALGGAFLGHGDDKEECHQEDTGVPVCTRYEAIPPASTPAKDGGR